MVKRVGVTETAGVGAIELEVGDPGKATGTLTKSGLDFSGDATTKQPLAPGMARPEVKHVKPVRTSITHPIPVSWAPINTPGRMGMTIAPGKGGPTASDYDWHRDVGLDLDRLVKDYKTSVLVCLIEDHEFKMLEIPNLLPEAKKRGINVERLPIPDLGTPSLAEAQALVDKLVAYLQAGQNVVIHCRGGNGRTGTIAACVAVKLGMTADQAIKSIRSVRPKAIETSGQEDFVRKFAQAL